MQKLILRHGDCVEVLKGYEDGSLGAIISDPPYDLTSVSRGGSTRQFVDNPYGRSRVGTDRKGFMGKTWDGTGIAFSADLWDEVYRVLQPGGVVKAFSGTRTFHRMASAMKAVGFCDLRLESWNYGSGFPKSLNIGKALDKAGTAQNADLCAFRSALEEARNQKGLSRADVSEAVVGTRSGACWNWESGLRVPTGEHWNKLVEILDLPSAMTGLRDAAERAVVGKGVAGLGKNRPAFEGGYRAEYDLTTPTTEAAQQWSGWGTALKPSWEPVVVGRKP